MPRVHLGLGDGHHFACMPNIILRMSPLLRSGRQPDLEITSVCLCVGNIARFVLYGN